MHRAMCRGSRCNRLAVTVQCHVVSPLTPLLLAGKYHLKGHSTLGVSASAEPFCTAVSGPAAYRRSLCPQTSAAAPRRQLFLAQVAKMCMSYACNRFLPGDAAGDGLKLQLISAHPTCGHCLFEWGWELAALQRSASSDSALLSTLRWQCRCRTIYAFRVALTRAWHPSSSDQGLASE